MMWDYVTLHDGTQIAYSAVREDGTVLVGIERPVDMGFDSARCLLPAYSWRDVDGFTDAELTDLESFLRNNAPLIFELAHRRGVGRAVA